MTGKQNKTILLVEDDQFIKRAHEHALKHAGYTVIIASDPKKIPDILKKHQPDLVMLDLMLPGQSGFDVLTMLKKDDETKKIPVIVCSSLGQEKDIDECRALGASDYVVKGTVSINELAEKVAKYI